MSAGPIAARSTSGRHEELGALLELTARRGEGAGITERRFLGALGFKGSSTDVKGLWAHLIDVAAARGTLDAETERLPRALSAPWLARVADREGRRARAGAREDQARLRGAL